MSDATAIQTATILSTVDAIREETDTHPALAEQMDLEEHMIAAGKSRYWKQVEAALYDEQGRRRESRGADLVPAKWAIDLAFAKVAAGITDWVVDQRNKGRGQKHSGYRSISSIDAATAAHIALRVVFNCLADQSEIALPRLSIKIGAAIIEEAAMREFEEEHAAVVEQVRRKFESRSRVHQRRVLRAAVNREAPEILERNAPDASLMLVGLPLVEIIENVSGLINTSAPQSGRETAVTMSEECAQFFEDGHARAQYFQPVYTPCVVPPRPWTSFRNGGYHYRLAGKLTSVKTQDKVHRAKIAEADMSNVYRALNIIQSTPWAINTRVLEVFDHCVRNHIYVESLPRTEDVEVPPCPQDIPLVPADRTPEQEERLTAWKAIAHAAWVEKEARKGGRHAVSQTLTLASSHAHYERIYFPHTCDFRGRIYPVTSFLTPQGTDWQKSLLHFADAKPVTVDNRGMYWLAVHGANCMATCPETGAKLDKAHLDDRARWVHAHTSLITTVALDPLGAGFDIWSKADAPFQFLAFCFEWADLLDALLKGETPVSRLPVALDGSCNGLQHFSAMLRDEIGGSAVNLVPHDRPADIYSLVKDRVTETAVLDAQKPELPLEETVTTVDDKGKRKPGKMCLARMAKKWLGSGQIDRDLCKRPVMTTPYGSKKYGIRDQLIEKLRSRKFKFEDGSDGWRESGYLSASICTAIGEVVVKARECMDWLQDTASLLYAVGRPIFWTAPSGFPVYQAYPQAMVKRVETFFHGVVFKPRLAVDKEGTLDRSRQINGVSPNFIHSQDASSLTLTVVRCNVEHAIAAFAMIHDSYATHAADTELLATVLRDVFVSMYEEHDPLGEYQAAVIAALAGTEERSKLKPLPTRGTLDLSLVRKSMFFFA